MAEIIGISNNGTTCTGVSLTDLDLALADLRNHFSIIPGEKWTLPDFGSNIPYYLFEPIDDSTIELIQQDVERVVAYDPRFSLDSSSIDVVEREQKVTINMKLIYIPLSQVTALSVDFDREVL